jgi:hypothetical protein
MVLGAVGSPRSSTNRCPDTQLSAQTYDRILLPNTIKIENNLDPFSDYPTSLTSSSLKSAVIAVSCHGNLPTLINGGVRLSQFDQFKVAFASSTQAAETLPDNYYWDFAGWLE